MHYTDYYIHQILIAGKQEAHMSQQCEVAFSSHLFFLHREDNDGERIKNIKVNSTDSYGFFL